MWTNGSCNGQRAGVVHRTNDLVLPPRHIREGMLKDLGHQEKDIAVAIRIILKIKNQRKVTVQNLGSQGMEEAVESASRQCQRHTTVSFFRPPHIMLSIPTELAT